MSCRWTAFVRNWGHSTSTEVIYVIGCARDVRARENQIFELDLELRQMSAVPSRTEYAARLPAWRRRAAGQLATWTDEVDYVWSAAAARGVVTSDYRTHARTVGARRPRVLSLGPSVRRSSPLALSIVRAASAIDPLTTNTGPMDRPRRQRARVALWTDICPPRPSARPGSH